jgi:hypothetical protein
MLENAVETYHAIGVHQITAGAESHIAGECI